MIYFILFYLLFFRTLHIPSLAPPLIITDLHVRKQYFILNSYFEGSFIKKLQLLKGCDIIIVWKNALVACLRAPQPKVDAIR